MVWMDPLMDAWTDEGEVKVEEGMEDRQGKLRWWTEGWTSCLGIWDYANHLNLVPSGSG